MAQEQYRNDTTGGSTLVTTLPDGAGTSVVVTSATPFPSVPQFRIRIDNELMLVTAVSGTTFTATRGAEGTTAAAHASGARVHHPITAGSLLKSFTRFAEYPAAPAYTEPKVADFTKINGATVTLAQNSSLGMKITKTAEFSINLVYVAKAVTATPYTITMLVEHNTPPSGGDNGFGLGWVNNSSGKAEVIFIFTNSTSPYNMYSYYNASFSAQTTQFVAVNMPAFTKIWLQVSDNGTSRLFRWSFDGVNFNLLDTRSNTDQFTATHVGFFCYTHQTNTPPIYNMISYAVT